MVSGRGFEAVGLFCALALLAPACGDSSSGGSSSGGQGGSSGKNAGGHANTSSGGSTATGGVGGVDASQGGTPTANGGEPSHGGSSATTGGTGATTGGTGGTAGANGGAIGTSGAGGKAATNTGGNSTGTTMGGSNSGGSNSGGANTGGMLGMSGAGGDPGGGGEGGEGGVPSNTPTADPRCASAVPTALQGSGTIVDPYLICLPAQLTLLGTGAYALNVNYQLGDDLDMSTLAAPFSPFQLPFEGKFDGRSHSITKLAKGLFTTVATTGVVTDLNLSGAAGASLSGLLGQSNQGTVQRVRASGSVSGGAHSGLLVGDNSGVIEDCSSSGTLQSLSPHIGGLVGRNDGTIRRSFSTATVSGGLRTGGLVGTQSAGVLELSYALGSVTATQSPGGLVGTLFGGEIRNCYAQSPLVSGPEGGGLIGNYELLATNASLILNSYTTSVVTGMDSQGFIGLIPSTTRLTVTNSYFIDTVPSSVGTPLTAAQMKLQASYSGWAFGSIWKLDSRISPYPSLAYQAP